MSLIPLIWIEAILPGLACAWVLFAPHFLQGAPEAPPAGAETA